MKRIEFNNITFGYRKNIDVFKKLNFTIENSGQSGLVVALMGASGCGKTTIFRLLLGLEKPQNGNIYFDGVKPTISYVPQEPILFEHLTPFENAAYFKHLENYKGKFNPKLFADLIDILELEKVLKLKSVNELSGGQKQKLSLLRALSIQPEILLLDEPCNGIDNELKRSFLIHLYKIVTEQNIVAIYVTHQPSEAKLVADKFLFVLSDQDNNASRVYYSSIRNAFSKPDNIQVARFLFNPFINEIAAYFDSEKKIVDFMNEPNCKVIFGTGENTGIYSSMNSEFEKENLSVYPNGQKNFLIYENELTNFRNKQTFRCLVYDRNGDLIHYQ